MFVTELFNNKPMMEMPEQKQVKVIYPGRFHPAHKGHKAVYDHLCKQYGADNVYVVTSDKVSPPKSPFNFAEKQKMWTLMGVPADKVVQSSQPYQAKELVANFNAENTILIFAVSEKDMAEDPRFQFQSGLISAKKDGTPTYFQQFTDIKQCEPLSKHGYIMTVPTFDFKVLGQPANSATQIRAQFAGADEATQKQIVTDLFGKFDPTVLKIMQNKLASVNAEVAEGWKHNLGAVAMAGAIAAGTLATPPVTVNGQKYAMSSFGSHAQAGEYKIVTADNGKRVKIWAEKGRGGRIDHLYTPVKEGSSKFNIESIEQDFGTIYPTSQLVEGKFVNIYNGNWKLFNHLTESGHPDGINVFYEILSQKMHKIHNAPLSESVVDTSSADSIMKLFGSFKTGNKAKQGDTVSVIELSAWHLGGNTRKVIHLDGFISPKEVKEIEGDTVYFIDGSNWPNTDSLFSQSKFIRQTIIFNTEEDAQKCLMSLMLFGEKLNDWEIENHLAENNEQVEESDDHVISVTEEMEKLKNMISESVLKFTTKNITDINELYEYTKAKAKMLLDTKAISESSYYGSTRADGSWRTGFEKRLNPGLRRLTNESIEHREIKPFIDKINQLDLSPGSKISVGQSLSVIQFEIMFAFKEIELHGFLTPKKITKIDMSPDNNIKMITFDDGDTYPRLAPVTYHGEPTSYSAFFQDRNSAESAMTMLTLSLPTNWQIIENRLTESSFNKSEITEITKIMNENAKQGNVPVVMECIKKLMPIVESAPKVLAESIAKEVTQAVKVTDRNRDDIFEPK